MADVIFCGSTVGSPVGVGGTPYNGLYGEAPPDRSTFLTPQVYERVGISRVEIYERYRGPYRTSNFFFFD